jgi:hypothetical protein
MRKAGFTPDEVTWREHLASCARHGNALLAGAYTRPHFSST